MNQTDRDVRDNFSRPRFDELTIEFERLRILASQFANKLGFFRIFVPLLQVADSEKVAIVRE